jgi:two-component system cell cycle response regulator
MLRVEEPLSAAAGQPLRSPVPDPHFGLRAALERAAEADPSSGHPGSPEPGDAEGEPGPAGVVPTHPQPAHAARVLVLNHHRDPLAELVNALRRRGFEVTEARSLADTQQLLDRVAPDLAILNPLVLKRGGVELELVDRLQRNGVPVPVILLVDGLRGLDVARRADLPFCDFLLKPPAIDECLHRVDLALRTREAFARLQARARELEGQVTTDHKTGLLSERYFRQALQLEHKRAQRHTMPLSLLLIDVDDFKSINDSTEYAFGDVVLRHVAESLRRNIRETDYAARFGGDEFVLLLPHTSSAEAVQTAVRIKKRIAETTVQARGYSQRVTISIGIDTFDGRSDTDPAELRARANKALHQAKRRGKNQVWLYTAGDPEPPPPTKR